MSPASLSQLLVQAQAHRVPLLKQLTAEGTDCYRLFHGLAEGMPGLTIDQYGELVLAQTFRDPLTAHELETLEVRFGDALVYNHRGERKAIYSYHRPTASALEPTVVHELGLKYSILARHRGIDPHLFLDLRMGRRWLQDHARDRSVINLFAYSCGMGQVAAAAGAREVWNVDFSESSLRVGEENLALNGLADRPVKFIKEDYFPVIWQLAGMGVKGKRARRRFQKFEPRQFDLVLLDPPAKAKGPFHTVDLINDYQSVFKPAWLVTASGGTMLAANNVGTVDRETFENTLTRCAEKCGKPIAHLEWLEPDADFPSFDGNPALKVALCKAP